MSSIKEELKKSGLHVESVPLSVPHKIPLMGTSGVRKPQEQFNADGFLEQFIEGIALYFETLPEELLKSCNYRLILGGDPRLGNLKRITVSARIFAAHGFTVEIAKNGVATTPAVSHAIRKKKAFAGVIFTASHNPYTDAGIKVNNYDGSPALEDTATAIHRIQNSGLTRYSIINEKEGRERERIVEFDAVALYSELMDHIFNFEQMKKLLEEFAKDKNRPLAGCFDGMGGAAGIFARNIFSDKLNINGEFYRCEPDPHLGGAADPHHPNHPEPDFDYIPYLIEKNRSGRFDILAAYDSDGDRRLDGGSGFWIESADEFALFASYADLIPLAELFKVENLEKKSALAKLADQNKKGTMIFARSNVTSDAIDLMEKNLKEKYASQNLDVKILETATGFKWIAEYGNWGVEESNGVGNPFLREKDGIFATLYLLKIMLVSGKNPGELVKELWNSYGRVYFTRGEISRSPSVAMSDPSFENELRHLEEQKETLNKIIHQPVTDAQLTKKKYGALTLESAEVWDYIDPQNQLRSKEAAILYRFSDGVSVRMRFSGTGSGGYTLRVYVTRYDKDYAKSKSSMLEDAKVAVKEYFRAMNFPVAPSKWIDANQPDPFR